MVFGASRNRAPLPVPRDSTPRRELERAILPALARSPCVVSFSGGRDSSTVLAVATHLARREGLPLPVPATNRFPGAAGSNESEWQERVVKYLGLQDWVRVEMSDELDCIGPIATRMLRRHGLLWPCNAHFHVPLLEVASGGALLTGVGGDEALSSSGWTRARALAGARARPTPRGALRVGLALSPRAVRRAAVRRRMPAAPTWLRPDAAREVSGGIAATGAGEPLGWRRRLEWIAGFHYVQVGAASLATLAADAGVAIVHPLWSRSVLGTLAALPRSRRFKDRTAAMELIVGDLLPPDVRSRRSKAHFDGAFWSRHSRALAASWDGRGVDPSIVDPAALRAEWGSERPDARSFTLLQAAWMASEAQRPSGSVAGEAGQSLDGLVERLPAMGSPQLPGRQACEAE